MYIFLFVNKCNYFFPQRCLKKISKHSKITWNMTPFQYRLIAQGKNISYTYIYVEK